MRRYLVPLFLLFSLILLSAAYAQPQFDTIRQILGRQGEVKNDVLIVKYPRTDLFITVGGMFLNPSAGAATEFHFQPINETNVLMTAEFVLLQLEVPPVTSVLVSSDMDIAAIHNHLINESPRLMYMHASAQGDAALIATGLKQALNVTRTPQREPTIPPVTVDWTQVRNIIGETGEAQNAIIEFDIPLDFAVSLDGIEMRSELDPRYTIYFEKLGGGRVLSVGEFACLARQVKQTTALLREGRFYVTGVHNHFLTEDPRLIYVHYQVSGDEATVARWVRAVMDQLRSSD